MAAIDKNPPTSFSISPTTHCVASSSQNVPPETPTWRRQCPLEIDLDLYTPTKRLQTLYSALGSNEEHRFLVSKSPLTSTMPITAPVLERHPHIPPPDWSLTKEPPPQIWKSHQQLEYENLNLKSNLTIAHQHARAQDSIIQGAHAQLVVQNLHLQKLNVALNANEGKKKKNECAILFEGKGQLFTSDNFFQKVEDQKAKKEAAAAKKISNAASWVARKEAQAKLDAEWARLKKNHKEASNAWKLTCDALKEQQIPKKSWPKAPTHPKKPKLPSSHANGKDDEPDEAEEENNGDDDM